MNQINFTRSLLVVVVLASGGLIARAGLEHKGSTCVPAANCGNCTTEEMPDAAFCTTAPKKRCIVNKGTPTAVTFEVCVDTDNGDQTCEFTSSEDPKITTCKDVKIWKCTTCATNGACDYVACKCSGMHDLQGESDVMTNDCT